MPQEKFHLLNTNQAIPRSSSVHLTRFGYEFYPFKMFKPRRKRVCSVADKIAMLNGARNMSMNPILPRFLVYTLGIHSPVCLLTVRCL